MTVRHEFQPVSIDPIAVIDNYLEDKDWRVRENSNVTFGIGGLILHEAGAIGSSYWLHKIYSEEISNAHKNCDIHLHDLGNLYPYCAGWNIRDLLEQGLGGVRYKVQSGPAKHLTSAVQQIVNFLGILQNEWAGAQAFNSFDTYLAPFIRKDNLSDADIKQAFQFFLFGINTPSRWGCQSPFSNITLDLVVPEDIKSESPILGGKKMPWTYGDMQPEMDRFNMLLFEVFEKGDYTGANFQYPIMTVNVTKDFRWDHPVTDKLFQLDAKHGTFYFSNMVTTDMNPEDLRSMCCRLRLDLRELRNKNGGLFGAAENTGSIGVATINLPKLGYLSHNKEELFSRIDHMMELCKESLVVKRKVLERFYEMGLYPYTKRYLKAGFANHFSTIGVIGMNEMCRNFFRNVKKKDWGLPKKEAITLCEDVLKFMQKRMSDFQEESGDLFNVEAIPGESTCYRFAKEDKKRYPDIYTAGTLSKPYYTNSCHLPVGYSDDPWVSIEVQEVLQPLFTGGTVMHTFGENNAVPWERIRDYIKKVITETKLPYVTWTPTLRECQKHGQILEGNSNDICPICLKEARDGYEKKLAELRALEEALLNDKEEQNDGSHVEEQEDREGKGADSTSSDEAQRPQLMQEHT